MNIFNFNIKEDPILNNVLLKFCKNNNITKQDIDNISKSDLSQNLIIKKINPIIKTYGISKNTTNYDELDEIYIRDIVGFEPNIESKDILDILNKSYSNEKQSYSSRMNDKLELPKEVMIEQMRYSFESEPICVDEVEGKYVVSINGCHRTSILRFLYINEVLKKEKAIEEIDEKYKIRAQIINKYDLTLTYINYLLHVFDKVKNIGKCYEKGQLGNYKITHNDYSEEIYSKDGLIDFFNITLSEMDNIDDYTLEDINRRANSLPSFKSFLKEYAPSLVKENEYGSLS